jgi:hypothetical protein
MAITAWNCHVGSNEKHTTTAKKMTILTTMLSDFDHVNLPEMKHGCLENPGKTI